MKKIQDILNEIDASGEIKDLFADYEGSSSYICDAITERSDSRIDVYYSNLFEWAKHNFDEIEAVNEELGTPTDIIKQIQQAQFLVFERELYEELETGVIWAIYKAAEEYADEISEDQETALDELLDTIDSSSRFDEISEGVKAIFQPDQE